MMGVTQVKFNRKPCLVLSITDKEPNETIASLDVDVLEVRVDQFDKYLPDYVCHELSKRKAIGLPVILTVRNDPSEGGRCGISDDEKVHIFEVAGRLVDIFDVELSSPVKSAVVDLAKKYGARVVVSTHNLEYTPPDIVLAGILKEALNSGADIVKIATKANSMDDVKRLLEFTLKNENDNIVTISLGRLGAISRLVFPMAGSLLTYTYMDKPTAEGQIRVDVLKEDLRRYYPDYKNRG